MKDKVLFAIKNNNMLKQGDSVVVGLSGGADSVALLCVLLELADIIGFKLSACHINHCLRGAESDRDEQFCRELCAVNKVDFTAKKVDVKAFCAEHRTSTEEGARELRYAQLLGVSPAAKVATAHTLSDNAETVLMNLVRGSALDGLCGIPPVRGRIIRPLIGCTRAEIEEYLSALGQDYVTDSTNLSDDYRRNKIRHNVIPFLKELNPALENAIGRSSELLRADKTLLGLEAEKAINEAQIACETKLPASLARFKPMLPLEKRFDADKLKALPKPIRTRCLRMLLADFEQHYDSHRISDMENILMRKEGSAALDAKTDFACKNNVAMITRRAEAIFPKIQKIDFSNDKFPVIIPLVGDYNLKIRELKQAEIKLFVNNRNWQFKNVIDCDKINSIITLRPRKQGDSIALFGKNCTQTFKNILNAARLTMSVRDSLVVFSDGDTVIWLEGFGVCKYAAATENTKRAVLVEILEEQ